MPKPRVNNVTDEQIISCYARRAHSATAVTNELGVGSATISRVLAKHGIERVGLREYRKTMGTPKTEPYIGTYRGSHEQIMAWYAEGASMREIAKRIGRSTHVVLRIIREAGLSRPFGASGPDHSQWIGGRINAGNGYIRVWVSDDDPMASMRNHQGYVLEHRLTLARKLRRPLRRTETVHHIDGDRENNAPDNLELRQGKHGKHVVMCCLDCGSRNIGHVGLGVAH